jgi:hypothetical protein
VVVSVEEVGGLCGMPPVCEAAKEGHLRFADC